MPDGTGLEICAEVKAQSDARTLIVSGNTHTELHSEIADRVFAKPVNLSLLEMAVKSLLAANESDDVIEDAREC